MGGIEVEDVDGSVAVEGLENGLVGGEVSKAEEGSDFVQGEIGGPEGIVDNIG